MHSLLVRQFKRAHHTDILDMGTLSKPWQAFLAMVEQAYCDNDADLALVQRSIDIASGELVERNQKLVQQNARLQVVDQQLRKSRDELELNVANRTAELQEAKNSAERLKEHFQLLLDSTGEGIYGIDTNGKCSFVNHASARMLGYRVEEMLGRDIHQLIHDRHLDGSDFPLADCPIYRSLHTGQSCRIHEDTFWTRDNKPLPVEYSSYPMRVGNGVVGAVVAFSDITARKLVELELRQAKELAERASQTKSEFLARMSHEIRTPLNGVVGMIDQLVNSELTDKQKRYTSLARIAAESLMSVINDILDFSRIEAGKVEIDSVEFDLYQMVGDLVDLFKPVAGGKHLELSCSLQQDMPRRLTGDSNRIRQVLTNLIANAIKFTAAGSIRIYINLQTLDPGHCLIHVEIVDTGMGIPPEQIEHLFKRFSQLDSSITRQFGGTGLGLAICKRLVELMGGQIGVHSIPKQGSTFWFTLPLQICASSPSIRPSQLPMQTKVWQFPVLKGLHLLVAEDNEMNQFVVQETLKRVGCTCDIAADGIRAVQDVGRRRYDLILMDCQMPEMDGLEATRRIRQIEQSTSATLRIPIIALTAEAIAGDRERCLASGMDGYISKPINAEELFAEISRLTAPLAP
jgi:PAS domain S-box-containing protein